MHYLLAGLTAAVILVLVMLIGPMLTGRTFRPLADSISAISNSLFPKDSINPPPSIIRVFPDLDSGLFSRDALNRKLKLLRDSSPVTTPDAGAMCYAKNPNPGTVDYICPIDGERTQHARDSGSYDAVRHIEMYRNDINKIKGLTIRLDESELCKKCRPTVADPKLVLIVSTPGMPEHRYRGVTRTDLALLNEFLRGDTVHPTGVAGKVALKDYLPKIQNILGVDADTPGK